MMMKVIVVLFFLDELLKLKKLGSITFRNDEVCEGLLECCIDNSVINTVELFKYFCDHNYL